MVLWGTIFGNFGVLLPQCIARRRFKTSLYQFVLNLLYHSKLHSYAVLRNATKLFITSLHHATVNVLTQLINRLKAEKESHRAQIMSDKMHLSRNQVMSNFERGLKVLFGDCSENAGGSRARVGISRVVCDAAGGRKAFCV